MACHFFSYLKVLTTNKSYKTLQSQQTSFSFFPSFCKTYYKSQQTKDNHGVLHYKTLQIKNLLFSLLNFPRKKQQLLLIQVQCKEIQTNLFFFSFTNFSNFAFFWHFHLFWPFLVKWTTLKLLLSPHFFFKTRHKSQQIRSRFQQSAPINKEHLNLKPPFFCCEFSKHLLFAQAQQNWLSCLFFLLTTVLTSFFFLNNCSFFAFSSKWASSRIKFFFLIH